jgi:septal ring factor EnvC (AmiA/AmiB activator)
MVSIFLGVVYTYIPSQTVDELEQQKEELDRLKKDLEAQRQATAQLKSKEKKVLRNLNRIDQRIQNLSQQIRSLDKRGTEVENAILNKETDLQRKTGRLEKLQAEFGARVREIYKRTRFRDLEWLLIADSFTTFLRTLKYLNRVARENQKQYRGIVQRKKTIEQDVRALETNLQQQQKLKEEKEELGIKYQQQRQDRKGVLTQIRSKRSLYEVALKDKEAQYQAMQELIEQLEQARDSQAGTTRFGQARGTLFWPARGPVVSGFGKQRHHKYKIVTYNKGIEIKTQAGDPVKAVWKGKVVMVDWIRGYGKFIILDHGESYYTVYAHLSEILADRGDEVMRGELIGRAGDTGSIKGTVLHFELRQGKKALDPMKWLRK